MMIHAYVDFESLGEEEWEIKAGFFPGGIPESTSLIILASSKREDIYCKINICSFQHILFFRNKQAPKARGCAWEKQGRHNTRVARHRRHRRHKRQGRQGRQWRQRRQWRLRRQGRQGTNISNYCKYCLIEYRRQG